MARFDLRMVAIRPSRVAFVTIGCACGVPQCGTAAAGMARHPLLHM